MQKIKNLLLMLAGILFLYACEYEFIEPFKPVPPDPEDTISFATEIAPIFGTQNCTQCHNGTIAPDLRADKAYQSIMDNDLVNLTTPAESIIYTKPFPGGGHAAEYDINQAGRLLGWIQQGALNN